MASELYRRIAFIGAGRVATALARGFTRAGHVVSAVANRNRAAADALAASLPGCRALGDPQDAVRGADLVFLTVADDAIPRVAAALEWRAGIAVVHCSGATDISALEPAARSGAQIGGFHPLQTFTDPETALAGLPGCVVAIEAEEPLATRLREMAETLGARPISLPQGARALYHCAGGFAAGFIAVLLHEATCLWRSFGKSDEEALRALLPLARGTLDSIARSGTEQALTGPIARGDIGTVEKHVAALAALDERTLALYRALARGAIPIGLAKGTLGPDQAQRLERILEGLR